MRNFISAQDAGDIDSLIRTALEYKSRPDRDARLGQGKRLGMLFFNPSLRTRMSTQIAAKNLGLDPIVLNAGSEGWSLEFQDGAIMNGNTVEHVKDAAPILGSYFDILALRTFPKLQSREEDESDPVLQAFLRYAGVPLVSLESAILHPLQSLADLTTIKENHSGAGKPRIVMTWAPHIKPIPHCVANSFAQWVQAWGKADFVYTAPPGYELSPAFAGNATYTDQQAAALEGADFIYVKNWSSVSRYGKVLGEHPEWMLTENHLACAPRARIMHCLPLRRNVEVSDGVLDGPRSLLTPMAVNRTWSAQAVLSGILKGATP